MTHFLVPVLGATAVDTATFTIAATVIIIGAVGVVMSRNPVHSALMLVMTLFGVAVLFVEEDAGFLAAVQVIVYAGAIVVLFLFVIMFLGVDREENLELEPLRLQRPIAAVLVALTAIGLIVVGINAKWAVGPHSVSGPLTGQPGGDVATLGRSVFTTYLFPFEATAGLLVIAVVGAVVLARRPRTEDQSDPVQGADAGPTAAAGADGSSSSDRTPPADVVGDAEEVAR